MIFSPRSIALQGIGYGVLAIALQGFAPSLGVSQQALGGGGTTISYSHEDHLRRQIMDEDDIIILTITQMIVAGAFA